MRLSRKAAAAATISVSLLLAACGNDKPSASDSASPTPSSAVSATPTATPSASPTPKPVKPSDNLDDITVTGAYGKEPTVKVKAPWTVDKTRTKVLKPGDGPALVENDPVEVNYYGLNARTGESFDSSFQRGESATFSLDQVVPGFRKGLVGQRQGSRVLIAMPGSDGYDASGGNPQIGVQAGDTLVFVVDIVAAPLEGPQGTAVTPKAGLPKVTDTPKGPEIAIPAGNPPTTLQVQPLIKGQGAKVAESDTITFDYRWVRWSDGKTLEQTYTTKPATAPLSGLLPGMVKGLTGQTVGSRVLLVIPPSEGYPDGNATPSVAPTETLVLVVDLLFTQGPG